MANAIEFVINMTTKGLKAGVDQIKNLGRNATDAGKSYQAAEVHAKNFYNAQEKGIIGVANSTKSFSKLAETIKGGGSSSLVGAYATLAANMFAVSAAFLALKNAAAEEQVLEGLKVAGDRIGLTYSSAVRQVRELSEGLLSTGEAATATAKLISGGFKTDTLDRVTVVAKNASFALGGTMTDAMDRLTVGITKVQPKLLGQIGLMTKVKDSSEIYAAQLHKNVNALTSFEIRQGFANAVLAEGELKFGGISEAAGDVNPYTKLGSSFQDMSKTILNSIGVIVGPLANFFSSTKLGLAGVALLFASTIRKQLLPGLSETSEKLAKASEKVKAENIDKLDKLGPNLSEPHLILSNEWLENAKKGTVQAGVFKDSLHELDGVIKEHNDLITQLKNTKEIPGLDYSSKHDTIKSNQADVIRLEEAKRQAKAIEYSNNIANAQSKAAGAIGNAGKAGSLGQLIGSIKDYGKAGDDVGEKIGKLDKFSFAAGKSVQFFGSTILKILPWLGVLTVILSGLTAVWNHFWKQDTKEYEKMQSAIQDINDSVDQANKKMEILNNIEKTTATLAQRTAQSITIKSNAISELSQKYSDLFDAMKAVDEASKTAAENDKKSGKSNSFGSVHFSDNLSQLFDNFSKKRGDAGRDAYINDLGIDKTGVVGKTFGELARTAPGTALLADLDKLNRFDPIGFQTAIAKYQNEIKKAGSDTLALGIIGKEVATDMGKNWNGAADAVTAFQQATSDAGEALSEFITSSITSTQYDKVVDRIQGVTSKMRALQESGSSARGSEWSNLLSGVGSEVTAFMTPKAKTDVDKLNINDNIIQKLTIQNALTHDLTEEDKKSLANAQEFVKRRVEIVQLAAKELGIIEKTFDKAQERERLSKSEIAILQARISASSHLNSLTGEGVRAQLANEDRINKLQISSIEYQKATLINSLAQLKNSADEVEFLKKGNAELQQKYFLTQRNLVLESQEALARIQTNLTSFDPKIRDRQKQLAPQYSTPEQIARVRAVEEYKLKYYEKQLGIADGIIEKTKQRAGEEQSIAGLINQENVLKINALSLDEQDAKANEKTVSNLVERLSILHQVRDITADTIVSADKIAQILSGGDSTATDQIKAIDDADKKQRETIRFQAGVQRATAAAQLRIATAEIAAGKGTKESRASALANFKAQQSAQDKLIEAQYTQLDQATKLAKLEKLYVDTGKEGLEWQKQGLTVLDEALQSTKALQEADAAIANTREQIARKRLGIEGNNKFQESDQIKAATLAYKLAVDEASVKKAMIILEFELIKEQRGQLIATLVARKEQMLLLKDTYNENSAAVLQINRTLELLGKFNPDQILAQKTSIIDRGVTQARDNLALATTRTGAFKEDPQITSIRALSEELQNRADARVIADRNINTKPEKTVIGPEEPDPIMKLAQENAKKEQDRLTAQIKASTDLVGALNSLRDAILNKTQTLTANTSSTPLIKGSLADFAKQAINAGLKVSEMDGYGGVHPKAHKGRGHVEGRAFDASIAPGLLDSTNPANRAKMDALTEKFVREGLIVLWNGKRYQGSSVTDIPKSWGLHKDHMHVEEPQNFASNNPNKSNFLKAKTAYYDAPTIVTPPKAPKISAEVASTKPNTPPGDEITVKGHKFADTLANISTSKFSTELKGISDQLDDVSQKFAALGPNGEVAAAISSGMSSMISGVSAAAKQIGESFKKIKEDNKSGESSFNDYADVVSQALAIVSAGITSVANMVATSATAKESNIDREIAAEQLRDGKSAASLEKINSLEKKKDTIARKAFETNKKLAIANAIVSTAEGIAQALKLGPILGPILGAMVGALGAAQIAVIAGTTYQSSYKPMSNPTSLTIGKIGDSVDVGKYNQNVGGELAYIHGAKGAGSTSANYKPVGSAYGGPLPRGYGNNAFIVGEKGPEILERGAPISVRPMNDNSASQEVHAHFNIQAFDGESVQNMLYTRRGDIIDMLRETANANGTHFLESVNTSHYKKPNAGGTKI